MKINKIFYRTSVTKLTNIVEDIKVKMSDNLELKDDEFITNCKALDLYLEETREGLLRSFKNINVMKKIVIYSEDVLVNEVKPNIKYMGYARNRH